MKYQYFLMWVEPIGPVSLKKMVERGLGARELYSSSRKKLEALHVFSDKQLDALEDAKRKLDIEKLYDDFVKTGVTFYCIENEGYPEKLKAFRDAPYGLFVKGKLPDPTIPSVAIVGARNCTTYGAMSAYSIGRKLSERGIQVISGLARGVDSKSQKGALEGKTPTFAVMGCGIDQCYPPENYRIYNQIMETGGIISEYPVKAKSLPYHFPMRNRIISGLSDAVIVIEARKKSGSLITAEYALNQGKEIFALPGQIDQSLSEGTNELIRQGAGIVVSVDRFLEDVSFLPAFYNLKSSQNDTKFEKETDRKTSPNKESDLVNSEKVVYSSVNLLPKSMETIRIQTGLAPHELMVALMSLVKKGMIIETAKNQFSKVV